MKHLFIFVAVWTLYGTQGRAATNGDFFCAEMPQAQPVYYDIAVKNCGNTNETTEGVCTQSVFCTYVNESVKTAAKEALKKDYSALSDDEKKKFVKEDSSVEWFPTNLTCQGAQTALGPVCPSPEQCKGDVFYKMRPAFIAPEKFQEIQQRQLRGNGRVFQGSTAEAAK